jgi:tetratricopeptide (TPR) repeat protein
MMNDPALQRDLQMAVLQIQNGNPDQAKTLLNGITARHPENGAALYLLGVIAGEEGDDATAWALTVRACRVQDCPVEAFLALPALAGNKQDRLRTCRDLFGDALRMKPGAPELWLQLGLTELGIEDGDTTLARDALQKAIDLGLRTEQSLMALALVLEKRGEYTETAAVLRDASADFPRNGALSMRYAETLQKLGDWIGADRQFFMLIRMIPDDGRVRARFAAFRVALARHYRETNRYEDALNVLADAEHHLGKLGKDGDQAFDRAYQLGLVEMTRGNWKAAEDCFRAAISINPDEPAAHRQAGYCASYQGNLDEAADRLGEALSLAPAHAETGRQLSHVRRWRGNFDANVIYSNDPVEHDAPFKAADLTSPEQVRQIPMVVPADHDFELNAAFSVPPIGQPVRLLGTLQDHAIDLSLMPDRSLTLSLGDGSSWSHCEGLPAGTAPADGPFTIAIRRADVRLSIRIDDGDTVSLPLADGAVIAGDNLVCAGMDPASPGRTEALSVHIRNYDKADARPVKRIDVSTIFYGSTFARLFGETMLPSLLLPDNLPDLQNDYEVVHNICCTPAELPLLDETRELLERAGIETRIDTELLGSGDPAEARARLHLAVVDQSRRSMEDDAVVIMSPPDHVFGRGLGNVIRAMQPYEYLLCGHPRIAMETASPVLREMLASADADETVTNARLVRLAMEEHPHGSVLTGIANPDELWWNSRKDGPDWLTRFKEPPPVAWHPAADMISVMTGQPYYQPFETIDHDIADLMHRTGRLAAVDDSNRFFWVEYCNAGKNLPTIHNRYWSPAARMLSKKELRWRTV